MVPKAQDRLYLVLLDDPLCAKHGVEPCGQWMKQWVESSKEITIWSNKLTTSRKHKGAIGWVAKEGLSLSGSTEF